MRCVRKTGLSATRCSRFAARHPPGATHRTPKPRAGRSCSNSDSPPGSPPPYRQAGEREPAPKRESAYPPRRPRHRTRPASARCPAPSPCVATRQSDQHPCSFDVARSALGAATMGLLYHPLPQCDRSAERLHAAAAQAVVGCNASPKLPLERICAVIDATRPSGIPPYTAHRLAWRRAHRLRTAAAGLPPNTHTGRG